WCPALDKHDANQRSHCFDRLCNDVVRGCRAIPDRAFANNSAGGIHRCLAFLRSAPFADTFWAETHGWNLHNASLPGSSHYALPSILPWFTANLGAHTFAAESPSIGSRMCCATIPGSAQSDA